MQQLPNRTGLLPTLLLLVVTACQTDPVPSLLPAPTEVKLDQEEGNKREAREAWIELSHRTAPGVDWRALDAQTRRQLQKERQKMREAATKNTESFANGQLTGSWDERGSLNQAGNLETVDYDPDTDIIYGISAGGIVWRGNLDGTGWISLKDDLRFAHRFIQVIPNGSGGKRILAAIGKNIWYSDDDGANWTESGLDVDFYDGWGSARNLVVADDGSYTLYYLAHTWDAGPWASRMWVYASSDRGQTFNRIGVLGPLSGGGGVNAQHSSLWAPMDEPSAYLLHQGEELYQLSGGNMNLLTTNNNLPSQTWLDLDGTTAGGSLKLYALVNKNTLYSSTDNGANWINEGTLPVNSWDVGIMVSPTDEDKVFFGEVECYRSFNSGDSWSRVTPWWQYYTYPDSLHADIMDLKAFEKADGTPFILIPNHGGLHVSYNDLVTTTNIGLSGLNISQYYDVRTDPLNDAYIYGGTQDQGFQKTSFGNQSGPVNFDQVISGDYGHLAFSNNDLSLWKVYPFGWVSYYFNAQNSSGSSSYDVPGSHPPVADWIYPTAETALPYDNCIYVAGGNVSGGTGSYLIELCADFSHPYTITPSQINYNFRSNSNAGNSPISAIEADPLDTDRIYVATDDGTFFYSDDLGTSWNISSLSNGPGEYWLYGACILASQTTPDKVLFAGSGYSSPPVFVSTDGGQTFSPMSNGLPSTLVHELVANTDETLYFAATEVGPFVYVVSEDQWYPMMGVNAPLQRYYSVEYIPTQDIVRFATYGRGIWDFEILSQPLPVELLSFRAERSELSQVALRWETATEQNSDYFAVEHSTNGTQFTEIDRLPAAGFATDIRTYQSLHTNPASGTNYYRLRMVDTDDSYTFSEVRTVHFSETSEAPLIYPNPVAVGEPLFVTGGNEAMQLELYDLTGQQLAVIPVRNGDAVRLPDLPAGTYAYRLHTANGQMVLRHGKLVVL